MSDEFSKAEEIADKKYDLDFIGILLNTLVSATSSLTATGLLNFVQSLPSDKMPLIFAVVFVAQVVPKLLLELNKAYRVNKAKRKGYEQGLLDDRVDGKESIKSVFSRSILYFCEHATYF